MIKTHLSDYASFYFIGIGGVSMSALAKYLRLQGKKVAGSDSAESVYTQELRDLGIHVTHSAEHESVTDYEVVVYTDAVRESDYQLTEATRLKKKILSRGRLLYEISKLFGTVIAISGCHGKTTCTAMLAHIFKAAGKNFTAHIGGRDKDFKNLFSCGNDYLITEACEYKRNFLFLKPTTAVVLNDGADHLECYGSRENLTLAYRAFTENAEKSAALYGIGIPASVTFGSDKNADYYADSISEKSGKITFSMYERGELLGEAELGVCGGHNVYNALAAAAVARMSGIDFVSIADGLSHFTGVERRFENLGNYGGVDYIADYAHHPDEIKATLNTAQKLTAGNLYVVFQPHTYSRTKNLFKEFVDVLSGCARLLVYKTYAAREYYDDAGSALTLSQSLDNCRYGDDIKDIDEFVKSASDGDTVLFLGAGDIYDIAKKLLENRQ